MYVFTVFKLYMCVPLYSTKCIGEVALVYTNYITSFTLDTQFHKNTLFTQTQHMEHVRHIRDFLVKRYGIHTHNKRNSPQTHDKIILITDLHDKLPDKTDHFTRNSNFRLYNSDLYSSITMRVLSCL